MEDRVRYAVMRPRGDLAGPVGDGPPPIVAPVARQPVPRPPGDCGAESWVREVERATSMGRQLDRERASGEDVGGWPGNDRGPGGRGRGAKGEGDRRALRIERQAGRDTAWLSRVCAYAKNYS